MNSTQKYGSLIAIVGVVVAMALNPGIGVLAVLLGLLVFAVGRMNE